MVRDVDEVFRARRSQYRKVMIGVCVAAFAFALWNARDQYFVWDEWSYWTERRLALDQHRYADFFFREHIGHWHGIVMAVWLPLDQLFGLKSYLPYLIPTVVAHCVAGFLLFELLCHMRIRPVIAATSGTLYLFLASAAGNVSFGWQLCFTAPITLCYLALLGIERYSRQRVPWLTAAIVGCVMLAIASSNVGVTVMIVAAMVAAARRRLALAAAIVAIPGTEYVLWRHYYKPQFVSFRWSFLGIYTRYTRAALEATAEGLTQVHVAALAWLILAGAGAAVLIAVLRHDRCWPLLAATLAGSVLFYASLSSQRFYGASLSAFPPRYVHVGSALMLPSLAYLVDRLVTARRWIAIVAMALAAGALLANAREFTRFNDPYVADGKRIRSEVSATVALGSHLDAVPGSVRPYGSAAFGLTIADVRRLAHQGKLPCDTDHANVARMAAKLRIAVPPKREISCR